jgi:hypothetical protein
MNYMIKNCGLQILLPRISLQKIDFSTWALLPHRLRSIVPGRVGLQEKENTDIYAFL